MSFTYTFVRGPRTESFTSKKFFQRHAPDFNFELNEKQLIKEALERGFITRCNKIRGGITGPLYTYNPDYNDRVRTI